MSTLASNVSLNFRFESWFFTKNQCQSLELDKILWIIFAVIHLGPYFSIMFPLDVVQLKIYKLDFTKVKQAAFIYFNGFSQFLKVFYVTIWYFKLWEVLSVLINNKKDRYFMSLSLNLVFKNLFLSCCVCMPPPDGVEWCSEMGKSTFWKQYGRNPVNWKVSCL